MATESKSNTFDYLVSVQVSAARVEKGYFDLMTAQLDKYGVPWRIKFGKYGMGVFIRSQDAFTFSFDKAGKKGGSSERDEVRIAKP